MRRYCGLQNQATTIGHDDDGGGDNTSCGASHRAATTMGEGRLQKTSFVRR